MNAQLRIGSSTFLTNEVVTTKVFPTFGPVNSGTFIVVYHRLIMHVIVGMQSPCGYECFSGISTYVLLSNSNHIYGYFGLPGLKLI